MADKAARYKDAPIVSDHIPGGELDRKAPEPDVKQHIQGYITKEDLKNQGELFYKGYTNEGKPSDEEMWHAPPAQKLGRIADSIAKYPGGEGLNDLGKIGKKLYNGEPLSDAEKWQATYHTGRVAAGLAGAYIYKRMR
ncbi:hypothetical protein NNJEOMEG_01413 [Fundidesulfovibrio magnetotacticus]|uniref:Uncharacterized protein n=2 Tax=Fundidesulfovibrio magnetotacticus TaxID=2730080 RepID=A0A6V8LTZ7_9BACT|nr:hypothetical protein NNJEOMEG_01413 [Fundidesulfovibrio magnetotacticus]